MNLIKRFVIEDEGNDATEYALILGLVALAIIAGATALGGKLGSAFTTLSGKVSAACGGC